MPKSKQLFNLLPAWRISQTGSSLNISGGADASYEVELDSAAASYFDGLDSGRKFSRADLGADDIGVLEQLLTAEIVVPILKKSKTLAVKILGDKGLKLSEGKDYKIAGNQAYDLAVVVRTNSNYNKLLASLDYAQFDVPHLFVDLAFHHTISIGPLVFPGETACLACLEGRLGARWGDNPPPPEPIAAREYSSLAADITAIELSKIASGDTGLTNSTVAWNMFERSVQENQLLKVPLCPVCAKNDIDQTGALTLPWS